MAIYINVSDIETRLNRSFSASDRKRVELLIDQAGTLIDAYNCDANFRAKSLVSCNMVSRLLAAEDAQLQIPVGATQGSFSGLGYAQSFTFGSGTAAGEMYLTKGDKKLLGVSSRIGASNPLGELVGRCGNEW